MRLIDAGSLIAEMHNTILEDGEDRRIFYEAIERQPAIEAVEVVRCKECYWWDRSWQLIETKPELRNCKKLRTITREDWFCAEGKSNG